MAGVRVKQPNRKSYNSRRTMRVPEHWLKTYWSHAGYVESSR